MTSLLVGLKSLLTSPLFLLVTAFNAAVTLALLVGQSTAPLSLMLTPLVSQVVTSAVVWCYVIVMRQLNAVSSQLETKLDEVSTQTIRAMIELSGDQARIVESVHQATSNLKKLRERTDRWDVEFREEVNRNEHERDGLRQQMHASAADYRARSLELTQTVAVLQESLVAMGQDADNARQELAAYVAELASASDVKNLGEQIEAWNGEFHALVSDLAESDRDQESRQILSSLEDQKAFLIDLKQSNLERSAELQMLRPLVDALVALKDAISKSIDKPDETNTSRDLSITNAIDRLNLEIRRQMALLRAGADPDGQ